MLRYGENPHQKGEFVGKLEESFTQLHGKELSYNNLIDTEAAIMTVSDFKEPAFAIIKHMNACGLAVREEGQLFEAYRAAYNADPISAFGGILASNRKINEDIAKLIKEQKLFIEVIIAPDFSERALEILMEKKDCRILKWNNPNLPSKQMRSCFTGILAQDRDTHVETTADLKVVTKREPTEKEKKNLLVAAVATKHLKSNSVALVKDGTLLSMGCGQTSRIDALKQAIDKAEKFGFSLKGAVLSSEAFFPFPDCVELAASVGVSAVIHPGGSKNDQASIEMADKFNMAMVITGFRHFKH
jgi:phosphoribosylaminoimidazolecarboxamide formyltransferase/IMP cyclohydrolase